MKSNQNISYHIDPTKERGLHGFLENKGCHFENAPYAFWRASLPQGTLTFFTKGTLLIQAAKAQNLVNELIERGFIKGEETAGVPSWIGTDEAGKGDYFGPLVIAGLFARTEMAKELFALGVRDSKRLADSTIAKLAQKIKMLCPHAIITIMPERYNRLIGRMKNLNRLLAWGHARAIENILEKESSSLVISDQFGDKRYLERALMKRGKEITLNQHPHAEKDSAVAGASILARNEFVERLASLSREYGITLPKGAGEGVIEIGKALTKKNGKNILNMVAKVHFKTTKEIIANQ